MSESLLLDAAPGATLLTPVSRAGLGAVLAGLDPGHAAFARASRFEAAAGALLPLPGVDGRVSRVLLGAGPGDDPFLLGAASAGLAAGDYALEALPSGVDADSAALGWLLGTYRYDRYKTDVVLRDWPRLVLPAGASRAEAETLYAAVAWVRDLVNTPASDLGPAELESAARDLAQAHGAEIEVISGERLARDFPMVQAVGQGSPRAPRLIDLRWGPADAPRLTLVGKGVCFDTGGLHIKTGTFMNLMKKDMGGAAHALALGRLVMGAGLPVRLRVLVPAVENSVDGHSFRPGDVLRTRKGVTVEIGTTDAEGRLVLGDALAEADVESPDVLIDFATLTGAARVALGPHLAPYFTDDEALAQQIAAHAAAVHDPVWRLPLWRGYRRQLDSKVADLNHISSSAHAGAITAALFLQHFVEKARAWVHFDVFAWTDEARPGRPVGGEAQGLRAVFALLRARYGA